MPAERTQRRKLNFRQQDEIQRRYTDYVAAGLRRAQEMGVSWTAAERQAAHEEAARQIQENDMYPSVMPADPSPEEAVQWCKNNLDPWVNMETESLVDIMIASQLAHIGSIFIHTIELRHLDQEDQLRILRAGNKAASKIVQEERAAHRLPIGVAMPVEAALTFDLPSPRATALDPFRQPERPEWTEMNCPEDFERLVGGVYPIDEGVRKPTLFTVKRIRWGKTGEYVCGRWEGDDFEISYSLREFDGMLNTVVDRPEQPKQDTPAGTVLV